MTTIPPDNFPDTPAVTLLLDGVERRFDVDEETLPDWVEDQVLTSGGFPYDKKMKREEFESTLLLLQVELVRMQAWMKTTGARIVILFEGRDAAGKGGTISALHENLNPRTARNVALPKPTEAEQGQWYFQRYVSHLPTRGELVSFDRSWYNRAGVEPVMGFCTPEQHERFLDATPHFERLLVEDGIHFFKFWLEIGRETQLRRFYDRRQSILKSWKFSPIDIAGLTRWDDYTAMRDLMFERTHTDIAPWTVIRSNDKRRARIEAVRAVLSAIPYEGRDLKAIGKPDKKIIGRGKKLLTPG